MSDRYMGKIKCPYCEKETEYIYNEEWGREQRCDNCKELFTIDLSLIARKKEEKK